MEFENDWTCSCGAYNIGDVFTGICWKCLVSWAGPIVVKTAEELQMCPDCRACDGFHTMDCPTHPLPEEWKVP